MSLLTRSLGAPALRSTWAILVFSMLSFFVGAEEPLAFTVTATRLPKKIADAPVQIQLIDRQDIEESGATSLDELLSSQGLSFATNGMGTHISLQGMSGERVLILVDGRRLIGRVANNLDAVNIPVASIERVEVVRGPQSALFGSDAIGGVINIITRKPEGKITGTFDLRNSGFPVPDNTDPPARALLRSQNLDTTVEFPLGPARSRLSLFAAHSFPYRDEGLIGLYPEDKRIGGDIASVIAVTPFASLDVGGGTVFTRRDDYISAGGSYNRIDTNRFNTYIRYETETAEAIQLSFSLNYQRFARQKNQYNHLLEQTSDNGAEQEDFVLAEASWARFLGDHNELSLFLSGSWNHLGKYNIAGGEPNERFAAALVIQNEYFDLERFSLTAGLRSEYSSDYGAYFSPKISGMVYLAKGFRLLPSLGLGYRAPNFLERYMDSPLTIYYKLGNPELEPEKSIGSSLGAEWFGKGFLVQASIYHNELFDEIVYDYTGTYTDGTNHPGVPLGLHIIIKENLARSSRSGLDMSGAWDLPGPLSAGLRYSYLLGWNRESSQLLDDQSSHRAGGWLKVSPRAKGAYLRAQADWSSHHSRRNHALLLLSLRGELPLNTFLSLYGGINNILAAEDRFGQILAGPEFYVGIKGSF